MTDREILRHIDRGANRYIDLFGRAEHMEIVRRERYSFLRPRDGEYGITFVYNIDLDGLSAERQAALAAEIKSLGMPFWLDLCSTDEQFRLFFGRERVHGQTEFEPQDEIYLAMLSDELPDLPDDDRVAEVSSPEEFAAWAKIANDILAGGRPDMHPVRHYPLCRDRALKCYIAYNGGAPAAVAATAATDGAASLEFVATLPELRRRGLASAVCARAVRDAFAGGAKIVTVRAVDLAAARLYQSLGFTAYNCAI